MTRSVAGVDARRGGAGWIARLDQHDGGREAIVLADRDAGDGGDGGGAVALSRSELAGAARETVEALRQLGLRRGDLVAVLAPPSLAGVVLIHALLEAGIVWLPLNARLSEPEQRAALQASRPAVLIVASELEPALAARLADGLACGVASFRAAEGPASLAPVLEPVDPRSRRGSPETIIPALSAGRREALARAGAALVLQTSGTSGRPKGVVLGLDNLIASAEASTRLLGGGPGDRWLLCMPLFHIGGLSILIRAVLDGSSVLLHQRFDARRVARALDEERISRVSLVATMLARVIDARGDRAAPDALELVLLGGGPASQSLLERARTLGYPIAPTYGLTEAASQVATRPPARILAPDSDLAGGLEPLPGVELRVVDEARRPVEAGVDGEIELRGPTVMQGYLDDPVATAAVLREGWLSTGDFGRIDARGGLRVLDRRSDLIVSGGENVYPAEVESVLVSHASLADAAVIAREDAEYGARPLACVVVEPGERLDVVALEAFCRERLAAYKVPTQFLCLESLPRTPSGKLKRRALADAVEPRRS